MPIATCKNCGRKTNSAVSNYWDEHRRFGTTVGETRPTRCYAAFVGGRWVRGCAFDQADTFEKRFALGLIEKTKGGK